MAFIERVLMRVLRSPALLVVLFGGGSALVALLARTVSRLMRLENKSDQQAMRLLGIILVLLILLSMVVVGIVFWFQSLYE